MTTDKRLGRYVGAAFLFVFLGSALSAYLSNSIFSSSTAETLEAISENAARMRWSAMIELGVTSVGIVVLAVLLYTVVRKQNPLLALVALGWWFAEAITLAVSTVAAFVLIPVSEAYVAASAATTANLLALGDSLVVFDNKAWEIHMVFFSLGALIWYSLMYQARSIPRWLSLWGVAAVAIAMVTSLITLANNADLMVWGYPTGVFELVIGFWLIAKGVLMPTTTMGEPESRPAELVTV